MSKVIHIARDFSRFPAGRFLDDGPDSGVRFRESFLEPSLRGNTLVTVILDDVQGLPPSFLEEAFGGLVRHGHSPAELRDKLTFVAKTDRMTRYPDLIWRYVEMAKQRSHGV